MPGTKVKRPLANVLHAFLSNASANESLSTSIYAEILEILQEVLKNNFVLRGGGTCADQKIFPGWGLKSQTVI